MNPTEPTVEQATAYFKDMANGESVPIAPELSKGLGMVRTPTIYHVITPTNQTLAQARETIKRQKVIRGTVDERPIKKVKREALQPQKKKKKSENYLMPGLD